jgi:hypothetical protein
MDFFASKVAMSICALLVIAILSGSMGKDRFVDCRNEIETVLQGFCELADRAFEGRSEGTVSWTVPVLSTGDDIELVLGHGTVRCRWDGVPIVREPECYLHTWRWDGAALNESLIVSLDEDSPGLAARSGDRILLNTAYVLLENDYRLLVFACPEFD